MSILALPVSPVNLKSLPAPVIGPVTPINRPRPCDCPEAPECEHCGSSGWSVSVDALILAGKPIPADALRRDMEACQRLIRTIDRMNRVWPEPTDADRLWWAAQNGEWHAVGEVSPETDGPTAGMLGLMAYDEHRDEERRYQDWCEGR